MDYLEEVRVWLETRKYWAEKGILRHDEMENLNKQSIEIINFILTALEGPSEEERKRLHFIMSRTAVDTWDGEKYMSHEQRNAARQSICAIILGHAQEGEKKNGTR